MCKRLSEQVLKSLKPDHLYYLINLFICFRNVRGSNFSFLLRTGLDADYCHAGRALDRNFQPVQTSNSNHLYWPKKERKKERKS